MRPRASRESHSDACQGSISALHHLGRITEPHLLLSTMAQDTQQQNGAQDQQGQPEIARLQLPTGEVLELPMLTVRHMLNCEQVTLRMTFVLTSSGIPKMALLHSQHS